MRTFRFRSPLVVMQHDIETWQAALKAFDKCEYEIAADLFSQLGYLSKALYNIGVCCIAQGRSQDAVNAQMKMFEKATLADPTMAVSHFQLAHLSYLKGEYAKAARHYEDVLASMRGNAVLEYSQTGLEFTLYECDVWYNHGLCRSKQGQTSTSLRSFMKAHLCKQLLRHDIVSEAISCSGKDMLPFAPPDLKVYRPKRALQSMPGSLLNSLTASSGVNGMHTPLPSLVSSAETQSRKVVAVAEGELRPHAYDFGSNMARISLSTFSLPSARSSSTSGGEQLIKLLCPLSIRYTRIGNSENAEELLCKIGRKLGSAQVKVKYADDQGDWLRLVDDDDLQVALETTSQRLDRLLILKVS